MSGLRTRNLVIEYPSGGNAIRAIDGLDLNSYPPNMPFCGRADWRPSDGSKPGSDLAMVQRGTFDQLGASHAICNVVYGAQAVFDPYMAAGFCKAINDWIAAEWLSKDSRLSASIVVPMQAPDLAVEEIERRDSGSRFGAAYSGSALGALSILGWEALGMRRRIVNELGEQDGPGGPERLTRPPEVQSRRVTVADRLLACGLFVDRLER